MKKLITLFFVLLASCSTYTTDGIYLPRYAVNDSIPSKRILIKYYPVYIQRHSPYYNHYYSPYWNTPYFHMPSGGNYSPSYIPSSRRGSAAPRPTPSAPGQSSGSKSPSNSGGKSKGGVIQ